MIISRLLMTFLYIIASVILTSYGIKEYIKDRHSFKKYIMIVCILLGVIAFLYSLMSLTNNIKEVNIYRNIILMLKFFILPFLVFLFFMMISSMERVMNDNIRKFFLKIILFSLLFQILIQVIILFIFPISELSIRLSLFGWCGVSFKELWVDLILFFTVLLFPHTFYESILTRSKKEGFKKIRVINIFITCILFGGAVIVDHILPMMGFIIISPILIFVFTVLILIFYREINKQPIDILSPKLLAIETLNSIPESVIFMNSEYLVKYANEGTYNFFNFDQSIIDVPIDFIFKNKIDKSDFSNDFSKMLELNTNEKQYLYIYYSAKKDEWGQFLGGAFLIEDVTQLTVASRKLEMLYSNLELEVQNKNEQLIHANNILHERLYKQDILNKKYKMLSGSDSLTNTINRFNFVKILKALLVSASDPLAVISIDIDDFKKINDAKGHWFGDIVLVKFAEIIQDMGGENFVLSRSSGDDFLAIVKNIKNKSEVEMFVRLLLSSLSEPRIIENYEIMISVSIGISLYPENGTRSDELIKNAELANFSVRKMRYINYLFYTAELGEKALCDLNLTNEIKEACIKNQFVPYYQPQVAVDSDGKTSIKGYESLARWAHPIKGVLTPYHFIDNASASGAIVDISYSILRQTCYKIMELKAKGFEDFKISVNVSSKQLKEPNFITIIKDIIDETNVDTDFLELEITERSLLDNNDSLVFIFKSLKQLGLSISIDDFGVAFASLNYIKMLPIDKLKVDKTFVDDIGVNKKNEEVLKTIKDLSNKLNFLVVFEGVEYKNQYDFLTKNNYSIIQGYYFYKPMSFAEIVERNILPINNSLRSI